MTRKIDSGRLARKASHPRTTYGGPFFKIHVESIVTRYWTLILFALLATATPAFAAPAKVCGLVTPAQAQAVIGGNVGAGKDKSENSTESCEFDNGQFTLSVGYTKLSDMGAMGPAMAKLLTDEDFPCIVDNATQTCEKLKGVGDGAQYKATPGQYSVTFLYHGYYSSVIVTADHQGGTAPGVREKLIAIAKQVLAKI